MKNGRVATIILLLVSFLFAENQETAYYKALQFEESGKISEAIQEFEYAASLNGSYSDEINEILNEYYDALGINSSPWNFRGLADLSLYAIHYEELGEWSNIKDNVGEACINLKFSVDYTHKNIIHSFGITFYSDLFFPDTLSALDTSRWFIAPGLEYEINGETFVFNLGVDFYFNKEDFKAYYFAFGEKDFFTFNRNRLGIAGTFSKKTDGLLTTSLFASFAKTVPLGFNYSFFLGARFESDEVVDYYKTLENQFMEFPEEIFQRDRSEEPPNPSEEWSEFAENSSMPFYSYNAKWLGPQLRGKIFYKFKMLKGELNFNLFYGFVLDGPTSNYEKETKFTYLLGPQITFTPHLFSFYVGGDWVSKRYFNMTEEYKNIYFSSISIWQLKAGVKLEL